MAETLKISFFPIIRHLSKLITPVFIYLPVSANQITAASLLTGLASAFCIMRVDTFWDAAAGFLFVVTYIFDNCDGEVARIKKQCTTFGMQFDTLVDWVVHSALFAAMGYNTAVRFENDVWLWLGFLAAAGGTFNYFLGFFLKSYDKVSAATGDSCEININEFKSRKPDGVGDWLMFIFRELLRADFCFIFLFLAFFDMIWVLVPAGAIGSQLYWITQCFKGANEFHV
jgi:phosphatidylglycerophosphate synthase